VRDFYFRRIRRIFPALALVLVSSLIAAALLMLPYEFKSFGREIFSGSTFTSNILYLQQTGYFDESGSRKPLLHLWSLGIEKQFYLFWPLFVWVIVRFKLNLRNFIGFFSDIHAFLNLICVFKNRPAFTGARRGELLALKWSDLVSL
jgi:peptidoglycan/LPS O-acetylase OafA/YrhL